MLIDITGVRWDDSIFCVAVENVSDSSVVEKFG